MKNRAKIKKKFEKWHANEISQVFHIRREEANEGLRAWLDVSGKIPENHRAYIEHLRQSLILCHSAWNEVELFARFIVFLLGTIDFSNFEKKIQEFGGRSLALPDDTYDIKGVVDWMTARARDDFEPETPYFFIHEYKRSKHSSSDPLGQLLIAMLAAQRANNDGLPIYGAWIVGKNWQFVWLNGDIYSESKTYDATDGEELSKIWLILNKTKQIIYDRVDKIIAVEKEAAAQPPAV